MSTVPVPVGLICTFASAGFSSTGPSAFNNAFVVNGNSNIVVPANALVYT